VIEGIAPQGHAPWLSMMLHHTPIDPADGHHPLPWLTPSLTHTEGTISWTALGNVRLKRHNITPSFCQGANINGTPQPYVIGAGDVAYPLCSSLTLSIACPRVVHIALHTGSNSAKDFGLHTFPKYVLQQLETAQDASWLASFRPPAPAQIGATPLGSFPNNLSIRFGAHRASIYGITKSAKTMALTAAAKDQTRESHANELTERQIRSKILDEEFPDYQNLLDNAEVESLPFTLPDLPIPRPAPSIYGQKRGGSRLDDDEAADTVTSSGAAQNPAPLDD